MFDLDVIEMDWKNNSFELSDDEVFEIFKAEGATFSDYKERVDLFNANLPRQYSAEDVLVANLFHDQEKLNDIKRANELRTKMYEEQFPKKKYLSQESQMKVIEGCMDIVFKDSRFWFTFFKGKVLMEKLYYICLYSLFDAVKYCIHYSTKSCFRAYVDKCIFRNMVKNVAKWNKISYRDAYNLVINLQGDLDIESVSLDFPKEVPCSASYIYEKIKNDSYNVDYDGKLSSSLFMEDYRTALSELTSDERKVMELLFDSEGFNDLSARQVSDFLIVEPEIVDKLKKSAIKKLRRNPIFDKYR